ncbi:MAG: hypothetical protein AAFY41_17135, partial [Bacteroidota bacterium]
MRGVVILFCLFVFFHVSAQETDSLDYINPDSSVLDSLVNPLADSTITNDSIPSNTTSAKKSDIETTINYNAKDSL